MKLSPDKARRLTRVARLYYEENRNQQEIAGLLGISRPLVSRMLGEARQAGIVEIRILPPAEFENPLLAKAKEAFGLKGGLLVPARPERAQESGGGSLNQALGQAALDYLGPDGLGGGRIGLGWGHIIGVLVRIMEKRPPAPGGISGIRSVSPMVGNSGASIRNYHSNENVRIVAHQAMAEAHFLHTPAFAETAQELALWRQTENYKSVQKEWDRLDIALVNIGNHPSTPDFASHARYGNLLAERQAVGRLIAYYFNLQGEIIHSDTDYAIQIPLPSLARSRHVVGICSAEALPQAILGALRTRLLTHLVAGEEQLRLALELA